MATQHLSELTRLRTRLEEAADDASRADLNQEIGSHLAREGNHDQALLYLNAARRHHQQVGNTLRLAQLDDLIGVSCAAKGEIDRALTYFDRGRELAREAGAPELEALIAADVGLVRLGRGEHNDARALLLPLVEQFQSTGALRELCRVLRGLAVLERQANQDDAAGNLIDEALRVAEECGDALEVGRSLLERAELHRHVGDARTAKRFYRRAISSFADNDLKRDLAEAYFRYGLFIGEAQEILPEGFADPPAYWLAKAQELFREYGALADLERVRDGFRRYGRRGTDRIADVQVLSLIQELKQSRLEVRREIGRLVDSSSEWFQHLREEAAPAVRVKLEAATEELQRFDRVLTSKMDAIAAAEERFLGALNTVVLERENIRTLLDLSRGLNQLGDPTEIAQDAVKMASQLTGADRTLLVLRSAQGDLELRASLRIGDREAHEWRGIMERVAGGAGAMLLTRSGDRGVRTDVLEPRGGNTVRLGHAIATPLRLGDNVFGGVYADKELCGGVFTEHDLDLLVIFCSQVATILENVRIADEMRVAARTKEVTLEAISDGVISVSPQGLITSLNSVAARILGIGAEHPANLSLSHFPDLAFLQSAMADGETIDARVVRVGTGEYLANAHLVHNDNGEMIGLVATFTEMRRAQSLAQRIVGSTARFSFGDIIGNSPPLRRQIRLAQAAAPSDSSLLITGESGTGKELFAQAIHNAGPRAGGPFVGINCAAIPRELLESELFGYEAGAFTGAKRGGHPGKFELAEGGTILLDEIGDMPLEMQAKLLRVLQERRVQRIGGTREIRLNARVITTTNRDLTEDVERGRFRQDLLFRLKVIHIPLPPLRERPEDIPLLVSHYLELFSARLGKKLHHANPDVDRALRDYRWPGNVRELENILESEVNLADRDSTILVNVPDAIRQAEEKRGRRKRDRDPVVSIEAAERELLRQALVTHKGRIPDVARALGVSRGTVYNKMRKFRIDPLEFRADGGVPEPR